MRPISINFGLFSRACGLMKGPTFVKLWNFFHFIFFFQYKFAHFFPDPTLIPDPMIISCPTTIPDSSKDPKPRRLLQYSKELTDYKE